MNARLSSIGLTLFLGSLTPTIGAEDYEQHIRHFASNTPPAKVEAALRTLREAGTNSFPALLEHLKDNALAEPRFFTRAVGKLGPDGTFLPATPTIGDACFDLLQDQIEGTWPKGFRDYYVLTPETVGDWLARHSGLSLQQLRVEAAQQSLSRAE